MANFFYLWVQLLKSILSIYINVGLHFHNKRKPREQNLVIGSEYWQAYRSLCFLPSPVCVSACSKLVELHPREEAGCLSTSTGFIWEHWMRFEGSTDFPLCISTAVSNIFSQLKSCPLVYTHQGVQRWKGMVPSGSSMGITVTRPTKHCTASRRLNSCVRNLVS